VAPVEVRPAVGHCSGLRSLALQNTFVDRAIACEARTHNKFIVRVMGHYSSGRGGSIDHNVDPPAEQLLLVGKDVIKNKPGRNAGGACEAETVRDRNESSGLVHRARRVSFASWPTTPVNRRHTEASGARTRSISPYKWVTTRSVQECTLTVVRLGTGRYARPSTCRLPSGTVLKADTESG
jgi:hypothetical protein